MIALALAISSPASAQLTQANFTCQYGATYRIVWDGWAGTLTLVPPSYPDYVYKGTLASGGRTHQVRLQILKDPQDVVEGMQGPGYTGANSTAKPRMVFWVDFPNTPNSPYDDQRFDGYMMTQSRNAIAGVTWWNGMVFGFFATNKVCTVG